MNKMTFDFNEEMNSVIVKAGDIKLQVIETDSNWSRFMVATSSGIRDTFYNDHSFEHNEKKQPTDVEVWMFKVAYEYFEMQRTRFEKQKALLDEVFPEITE